MPSPKKQHRETLTQIKARNQPSEDQQVARLLENILNSTNDSGTDESAHPPLEESRALISFLDNCPTPTQDEPPTARMLIAERQRRQVYHPHTEPISPIRTGIKSTQTTPATDNLSDSSSQTASTKLKHRGVDPQKTPRTALREFINTKDRATATSTPHTKNSRTQTSQPKNTDNTCQTDPETDTTSSTKKIDIQTYRNRTHAIKVQIGNISIEASDISGDYRTTTNFLTSHILSTIATRAELVPSSSARIPTPTLHRTQNTSNNTLLDNPRRNTDNYPFH